jgi:hypothetical protein
VICETYEEALDKAAKAEAELKVARIEADRLDPGKSPDRTNWLLPKLDAAVRHLRDAEDYARLNHNFERLPTADRIRFIYEQITEDIYNGSSSKPGHFEGVLFEAWGPTVTAIMLELHEAPKTMRGQPVSADDRDAFIAGADALAKRLGIQGLQNAQEARR